MKRRRRTPALVLALSGGLLPGCLFGPTDGPGPRNLLNPAVPARPVVKATDYHPREPAPLPEPPRPDPDEAPPARRPQAGPAEEERTASQPPPAVEAAPPPPPPPAPSRPPDAPLVSALRCLLEKHPPADAARLLRDYGPDDQEALAALLQIAAPFGAGGLQHASAEQVAGLLEQVQRLERNLQARAGLVLAHVCLCRDIVSFGVYDPLPPDYAYQAGCNGRPGERIRVYVEVGNFVSRVVRAPSGSCYETSLAGTVEVLDFQRKRVWGQSFAACVDHSPVRRRDFFIKFEFHVPAEVPPGQYTLVMKVRDNHAPLRGAAPHVAQCSVDFRVAGSAPRASAAGR